MTICKVNGMHCDCPPAEPGTVQWCSKCGEGVAHGVCRKSKPAEPLVDKSAELQGSPVDKSTDLQGHATAEPSAGALPELPEGYWGGKYFDANHMRAYALAAVQARMPQESADPIDMVLFCPACGAQHIDAEETVGVRPGQRGRLIPAAVTWSNPPHRSHLCHSCGHIWRPADVPTNGVAAVKTNGKADSALAARSSQESAALTTRAITKAFGDCRLKTERLRPWFEAGVRFAESYHARSSHPPAIPADRAGLAERDAAALTRAREVMKEWHVRAVSLGFDGVAELLAASEPKSQDESHG